MPAQAGLYMHAGWANALTLLIGAIALITAFVYLSTNLAAKRRRTLQHAELKSDVKFAPANTEKEKFLQDCLAGCRDSRQSRRNWCKETHRAWDENAPGYYSEGFKQCLAESEKKFNECCEQCRQEAFRRFGVG